MRSKGLFLAVAVVSLVVLVPATPSHAAGRFSAVMTGSGTINPGLVPLAHTSQQMALTGLAVGDFEASAKPLPSTAVAADAGILSCSFSGGSVGTENSLLGQGSLSGGCTGTGSFGATVAVACPQLAYDRFGILLILYGDGHTHPIVTLGGSLGSISSAKCTMSATGILGTAVQTMAVYGICGMGPTSAAPTTSWTFLCLLSGSSLNTLL